MVGFNAISEMISSTITAAAVGNCSFKSTSDSGTAAVLQNQILLHKKYIDPQVWTYRIGMKNYDFSY